MRLNSLKLHMNQDLKGSIWNFLKAQQDISNCPTLESSKMFFTLPMDKEAGLHTKNGTITPRSNEMFCEATEDKDIS